MVSQKADTAWKANQGHGGGQNWQPALTSWAPTTFSQHHPAYQRMKHQGAQSPGCSRHFISINSRLMSEAEETFPCFSTILYESLQTYRKDETILQCVPTNPSPDTTISILFNFLYQNSSISLLSIHQPDTCDFVNDIFHLRKQGKYTWNNYSEFYRTVLNREI